MGRPHPKVARVRHQTRSLGECVGVAAVDLLAQSYVLAESNWLPASMWSSLPGAPSGSLDAAQPWYIGYVSSCICGGWLKTKRPPIMVRYLEMTNVLEAANHYALSHDDRGRQ